MKEENKERPAIKDIIANIDVSDFDVTPYIDQNIIRPLPKQEEFLLSHHKATITFYGGSAGSAKTMGLLYDVFQHVEDPRWDGIVFRKTSTQLRGAGGVFTKASQLYSKIGAEVKQSAMRIDFPAGSTCRYSYLEHDKDVLNHQGLEYSVQYFEELCQFSRYQFMYMLSRLRSNADSQSFVKATMNPDPNSWVLDFVSWYLTPDGYADPKKSGKVRWFVSDESGNLDWADDPDTLKGRHGNDVDPMSFTFIQASIADNPILCKLQPKYLTALKNLPRVDREILLYGNWTAIPEASGYFKRDWVQFVDRKTIPKMKKVIRCWDLASSMESESQPNPDYTASVKVGLGEDDNIYILDAMHVRERPAGVNREIQRLATLDGKGCPVGIPLDSAASGVVQFQTYAKPLMLSGYSVKKMKTRKGKIERFLPFSEAAENGLVFVVTGTWNKDYYQELERFTGGREINDLVDATADGYNWLISGKKLPEKFSLNPSTLTRINQFANF